MLLQVLRVRDASGAPLLARRGRASTSSRRSGATPRSCSCSPASCPRSTRRSRARLRVLRPRRLRLLRRLDLRAGDRARAAAAHQPRRALDRDDLARLREVTASQGLMLESINPDLVVHQGSPTKHPARRAWRRSTPPASCGSRSRAGSWSGSARPRTSGSRRSRRSPRSHERHGHLQEVILQNFVPHPRYYGREVAEIADAAARGALDAATARRSATRSRCRTGRRDVSLDEMKRLVARVRGG